MKRKVCIITGTRADWGLLSPIAAAVRDSGTAELQIIATNMHLLERYGGTWRNIENDGFTINCRVPGVAGEIKGGEDVVASMAEIMKGMGEALATLKPDIVVILGDRYEMLVAASAALMFRIPVAHIAGGAVSEGAFDDSIRHAITKMSHIHLTETAEYRNRVIQLGENPENVLNAGAIGVWSIAHHNAPSQLEVSDSVGLNIGRNTLVITFHPSTLDGMPALQQCENLLAALDSCTNCNFLFTYPNNDPYGDGIIEAINKFVAAHPGRAVAHASLGQKRYFDVLSYAGAVVGNSSSGIVEAPSFGIPTLNIGIRQQGRTAAKSVYTCGVTEPEISIGLARILSPEFRALAASRENPYYNPDTLEIISKAILNTPLHDILIKKFHNLPIA